MKNFNPVDFRTEHIDPITIFRWMEKGQLVVDKKALDEKAIYDYYGITHYGPNQCAQIIGNVWDQYPFKPIIAYQTLHGKYHTTNQIPKVLMAYMYNKFPVEGLLYKDMAHIGGQFECCKMLLHYIQPSQKDKTNEKRFYMF